MFGMHCTNLCSLHKAMDINHFLLLVVQGCITLAILRVDLHCDHGVYLVDCGTASSTEEACHYQGQNR